MEDMAVLCGLALNPSAPDEVVLELVAHPLPGPLDAVLRRAHLPAAVAVAVAERDDPQVLTRLADHPDTPAEVLTALARNDSREVRVAAGRHRRLPGPARALLAEDPDPAVRRSAAGPDVPAAVLVRLLADPDPGVREVALTWSSALSPAQAALFEGDPAYDRAMAKVELTAELLERLLRRKELHGALASNPTLPVERMHAFLADHTLWRSLADNPAAPESVLEVLATSGDPDVHHGLLSRSDLPEALRRTMMVETGTYSRVVSLLPAHASLAERLSYLDHPNPEFRRTLTLSDDLPPQAIRRLAADPDPVVRMMLCENYDDVPSEFLPGAVEGWGGHSRYERGLLHPALTAEALEALVDADDEGTERRVIAGRPDLPPALLLRLADDVRGVVRAAAAANPALPRDLLRQALTDRLSTIRQGAASNPSLTAAEIEQLRTSAW